MKIITYELYFGIYSEKTAHMNFSACSPAESTTCFSQETFFKRPKQKKERSCIWKGCKGMGVFPTSFNHHHCCTFKNKNERSRKF